MVQQLYIAFYARPADPVGMSYWSERIETEGVTQAVLQAFFNTPESINLYGANLSTTAHITALYQNVLGRNPEPGAGSVQYWQNVVESEGLTQAELTYRFLQGTLNSDRNLIDARVAVANTFTEAIANNQGSYEGYDAAAIGRALIQQVDRQPNAVENAKSYLPGFLKASDVASNNPNLLRSLGAIVDGELTNLSVINPNITAQNAAQVIAADAGPVSGSTGGGSTGGGSVGSFAATNTVTADAASKKVTIDFPNEVVNNTSDLNTLKDAIKVSTDGTSFRPLGAKDTVAIESGNVVISFETLPTSNTLKLEIAAGALKDVRGAANPTVTTTALDNLAPAAPSFALATDSGVPNDGITNVGTINVTLAADAQTWQYSTDGGATWSAAQAKTVTTFTLAQATYAADKIQVRQSDQAGNTSTAAKNSTAITVDSTAPVAAAAFSLATDSNITTDGVTNVGQINVTLAADAHTWQYSTDGGSTWSAAQPKTTTSFTLSEGVYAANKIQVRQTDLAGNNSDETLSTAAFMVDTDLPPLAIPLNWREVQRFAD